MDEYILDKTLKLKNCTVNIYRPVLTEQERTERARRALKIIASETRKYIREAKQNGEHDND